MGFLGSIFAAKNDFEAKPLPGSGQFTQQDFAGALERARNPQINTGLLPTQQANETRGQQQQFAQGLQGQAAGTAPSVAGAQLQQGVQAQNRQAATAIGSQRGINPALAARLIAQQQAQNTQGMAGQAATAGIQERQAAQALLGNALAQQRGQDIGQAQNQVQAGLGQAQVGQQAESTAQQAIANQNNALVSQNQGTNMLNRQTAADNQKASNDMFGGLFNAGATAFGMNAMAEGGQVPGQAEVEGDSYANDKVPIMASPGEIVLPRSVASDPDKAKEFVAHLRANGETSGAKTKATPSQGGLVKALKHLLMAHGGEVDEPETPPTPILGGSRKRAC